MSTIIDAIEKEQLKTDVTKFKVGDGVRVHTRVVEGDKERIQIFAGIVIGRKGRGHKRNVHRPPHFLRRRGRARFPAAFAPHREGGSGKARPRPPRQAELPAHIARARKRPRFENSDRNR